MHNKQGFTLLELLIAAALVAVLAMFATQAFRSSASDIRIEDAKARALLLVNAAQRYYLEYPTAASFATGSGNKLQPFNPSGNMCYPNTSSVQNLVDCGFLEYRQVAHENKKSDSEERSSSINMWFGSITPSTAEVTVCFKGKSRITDSCTYCTSGDGFSKSSCE